ncbi:MAG: hypothetical protein BVN35_06140 [Proteobacteria bacterium ST_bin11]|nr:MAG: hypothetical protein BVN35_06140 [Proteobacteria bacterium ST_bin11]
MMDGGGGGDELPLQQQYYLGDLDYNVSPTYIVSGPIKDDLQLNIGEVHLMNVGEKKEEPSRLRAFLSVIFSLMVAALWVVGFVQSIYMMEVISMHGDKLLQMQEQLDLCACGSTSSSSIVPSTLQTTPLPLPPGIIHSSY